MQNQTTLPATPVHGIVTMPFAPYYDEDGITIYNADCRQVLPFVGRVDLLLTDPPYGIGEARKNHKSRGHHEGRKVRTNSPGPTGTDWGKSDWDDAPPRDWIVSQMVESAEHAIIFGGNFFGMPPASCWLVWDKDNGTSDFADCELAWTNLPRAVRKFKWRWCGMIQEQQDKSKADIRVHPTQKPAALMRWCLSLVPEAKTVLDPFMGSGTTLVAARLEGRKAIGIEISEKYCEAAVKRLAQKTLF